MYLAAGSKLLLPMAPCRSAGCARRPQAVRRPRTPQAACCCAPNGERRHDLGEARPAGRRGHPDLAGAAGIAVGHGDGAVRGGHAATFMPGTSTSPPTGTVGVAHQGEERVHALGREGAGPACRSPAACSSLVSPFSEEACATHDRKARHRDSARSSVAGRRSAVWTAPAVSLRLAAGARSARPPAWQNCSRIRRAGRARHARRRHWRRFPAAR